MGCVFRAGAAVDCPVLFQRRPDPACGQLGGLSSIVEVASGHVCRRVPRLTEPTLSVDDIFLWAAVLN